MDKPHKKLIVWQVSMQLTKEIYVITNSYPGDERFGLTQQTRKSVVSIPSNIAEGAARQGKREFKNFLSIAQGSLSELDTQLEIAVILDYLTSEQYAKISEKMISVDKMLTNLMRSLK